ncbi:MAG: hypothetical protein FWF10_00540 [Clostridiales bacterium]|nr:hypothetical protein [Clostridiales bacterium]
MNNATNQKVKAICPFCGNEYERVIPFYEIIGHPVEIYLNCNWERGNIVNGYRTNDGMVNVDLGNDRIAWCGIKRANELLREVRDDKRP